MLDGEMLAGARVTQPQLIRLYESLSQRPAKPLLDVQEASSWLEREAV